jgi:ABC-type transporter Mla subunit MlaD
VRDEIEEVQGQLQEVVEVQEEFAEGVRDVTRVQTKMVNAQDSLEEALDRSADLADDKLRPLLQKLTESVESFQATTNQLEEVSQNAEERAADFVERLEEESSSVWEKVGRKVRNRIEEGLGDAIEREKEEMEKLVEDKIRDGEERIRNSAKEVFQAQKEEIEKKVKRVEKVQERMEKNAEEINRSLEVIEEFISSTDMEKEIDGSVEEGTMSKIGNLFGS